MIKFSTNIPDRLAFWEVVQWSEMGRSPSYLPSTYSKESLISHLGEVDCLVIQHGLPPTSPIPEDLSEFSRKAFLHCLSLPAFKAHKELWMGKLVLDNYCFPIESWNWFIDHTVLGCAIRNGEGHFPLKIWLNCMALSMQKDPFESCISTILHELAHLVTDFLGGESENHGPLFQKCCTDLGLVDGKVIWKKLGKRRVLSLRKWYSSIVGGF